MHNNTFNYSILLFVTSIFFLLSYFSSIYLPLGLDEGKYFLIIKEISNNSNPYTDISKGTPGNWFFIITSALYQTFGFKLTEFRFLLATINFIGILILCEGIRRYYSFNMALIFLIFISLNPFVLQKIIEIHHYSITLLLLMLGIGFSLISLASKKHHIFLIYMFLGLISFTILANIRIVFILMPFTSIFLLCYINKSHNKIMSVLFSLLIIIVISIININYYKFKDDLNKDRYQFYQQAQTEILNMDVKLRDDVLTSFKKDCKTALEDNSLFFRGDDNTTIKLLETRKRVYVEEGDQYKKNKLSCKENYSAFDLAYLTKSYASFGKEKSISKTYHVEPDVYNYIDRLGPLSKHIKNLLNANLYAGSSSLIKVFFGYELYGLMIFITFFTLQIIFYFITNYKQKRAECILFLLPFASISALVLLRYMTSQSFSYLLHSTNYFFIINTINSKYYFF